MLLVLNVREQRGNCFHLGFCTHLYKELEEFRREQMIFRVLTVLYSTQLQILFGIGSAVQGRYLPGIRSC